jgi:uncharacterized membrane protein
VFSTSRHLGGALAVAVFGTLLAQPEAFMRGLHTSMLLAAGMALVTAAVRRYLKSAGHRATPSTSRLTTRLG